MRKHSIAVAGTADNKNNGRLRSVRPPFPFNSKQSTKGTGHGPWEALELRRNLELRWVNRLPAHIVTGSSL